MWWRTKERERGLDRSQMLLQVELAHRKVEKLSRKKKKKLF